MRYYGEFLDINKIPYRVDFHVSDGAYNSVREVTLGADPFVTTMDDGGKTIYNPIKLTGATINIITGNYYFNLYNQTSTNVGVTLTRTDTNAIMFKGYVTPNMYDQGFVNQREEISIECVDCLSVLENINYLPANRGIRSLEQVLRNIFLNITQPNIASLNTPWIRYVYFPENITWEGQSKPLAQMYVSEYAFADEKKSDEEDKDCCWKCDKVLEAICQLFGLTCVQWGEDVYFIDYDYLVNNGNPTYTRYYFQKNGTSSTAGIKLSDTFHIDGTKHAANSATLSLDKVYNKVTVKTKLRTYKSILPDFFDGATNITRVDNSMNGNTDAKNGMYGVNVDSELYPKDGVNRNMLVFVDQIYNREDKKYGAYNCVAARYMYNPNLKCYRYSTLTKGQAISPMSSQCYTDMYWYRGAVLAKMMAKKLDKNTSLWESIKIDWSTMTLVMKQKDIDTLLAQNDINSISLQNYIILLNPDWDGYYNNQYHNTRLENDDNPWKYPYLETITPELTSFFGGKNTYLVISGKVIWHDEDLETYPTPDGEYDLKDGRRTTSTKDYLFLPCKLQWGNKYWNGESWTTTNTGFKLYYIDPNVEGSKRADGLVCKEWNIPNSISWRIGSSEKGYPIPVPEDTVLSGTPKFTIYRPWDPKYNKSDGNKHMIKRMFLQDFKIQSIIADPTYSKDTNSDTIYTNVIDESFVDELKDITFNLSTYDNKTPAYNTICWKPNTYNYKYIDKVTNSALTVGEQTWSGSDPDAPSATNGLRFEEHFIYRLVNQYSTPSRVLEVDLHSNSKPWTVFTDYTLNDCLLIADKIEVDYKMATQNIKLVEKK